MIKHVILFRLKKVVEGMDQDQLFDEAARLAIGMVGRVPGLIDVVVGRDFTKGEGASDMCLIMDFEDRASFDGYATHPDHNEITPFFQAMYSERRVVDFEVNEVPLDL